jgi:hypothetical protein
MSSPAQWKPGCEGLLVVAGLSLHEANQIMRIFRAAGLAGFEHVNLWSS